MSSHGHELGLSQLISQIKSELLESQRKSVEEKLPAQFRINMVTIEVRFVVREVAKGDGGIDLKLFAVKAGEETESSQVHTVTLEMSALDADLPGIVQHEGFGAE